MSGEETGTDLAVQEARPLATYDGVDTMKAAIVLREQQMKVIETYIDDHFLEDVDFGVADDRSPKKTLLKPGAEKICGLFNTRPVWTMDGDTWQMLGSPAGVVCYKCEIIDNTTGAVIGEGRGAEKVGNKARDANKAIKNAEKCAIVDAALYTFHLSQRFTQDMAGRAANEATKLAVAKEDLKTVVSEARQGLGSDLTDNRFIIAVIASEMNGRKNVQTVGEVEHVKANFRNYDLATGEKIPE